MNRLWRATVNSWKGLAAVARGERAFQQELVVFIVAIPLAFVLVGSAVQRFMLIGSLVFVLVAELLNTAIEKLADRVTRKRDAQIGRVKDIASGAVHLAILFAGAVWLWAFLRWLWR